MKDLFYYFWKVLEFKTAGHNKLATSEEKEQ